MQVSVTISEWSEQERIGLQFAMDRFNDANKTATASFDEFLAEFIKSRLVPRFVQEETQTFKQGVQQRLRKATITGNDRRILEDAVDRIAPAVPDDRPVLE